MQDHAVTDQLAPRRRRQAGFLPVRDAGLSEHEERRLHRVGKTQPDVELAGRGDLGIFHRDEERPAKRVRHRRRLLREREAARKGREAFPLVDLVVEQPVGMAADLDLDRNARGQRDHRRDSDDLPGVGVEAGALPTVLPAGIKRRVRAVVLWAVHGDDARHPRRAGGRDARKIRRGRMGADLRGRQRHVVLDLLHQYFFRRRIHRHGERRLVSWGDCLRR